jgi:hypothetical protein
MTEVEVSRLFSELAKSTEILHKKSDSINAIIERFQEKLLELKPGLEVWLVSSPLVSRKRIVESEDGDEHRILEIAQELGYARVDREWTLAVREAQYNCDESGEANERVSASDPEALLGRSRRVRIEALKHFPELLRALKREVDDAIESIGSAEKFVK